MCLRIISLESRQKSRFGFFQSPCNILIHILMTEQAPFVRGNSTTHFLERKNVFLLISRYFRSSRVCGEKFTIRKIMYMHHGQCQILKSLRDVFLKRKFRSIILSVKMGNSCTQVGIGRVYLHSKIT